MMHLIEVHDNIKPGDYMVHKGNPELIIKLTEKDVGKEKAWAKYDCGGYKHMRPLTTTESELSSQYMTAENNNEFNQIWGTKTKDGREHTIFVDRRAFYVEWFFYTDDGIEPRLVSPVYGCTDKLFPEALVESWKAYVNNDACPYTKSELKRAETDTGKIDDEYNKAQEEIEKLPTQLYFEF